jgi:Rab-GTPase-TBC domain
MEHKRHKKVARLIRRKQRRLANLINLTLVQSYKRFSGSYNKITKQVEKDNTLRYYQGYHDVACIILSTLGGSSPVRLRPSENNSNLEGVAVATGLEMPAAVLLQISQSHFRDCMRANFLQLQTALRLTLLPLIAYFDPEIHDFLAACETEPFFALSWVITWFSHNIRDTELVKRLFDFFVVSHPLMPIYVSVAMVCHPLNREDILQTECDFSLVHQALSALPRNSSMVGWKYRPGDGYVSDDEHDIDEESSVGPIDSQSSVDTDFLLHEVGLQGLHDSGEGHLGAEAVSIVSSSMSSMFAARVPFQELIDTAISYMERMPPRNLIGLATRYYGRDQVQGMVDKAPGISFLQTPPAWTRAPNAKSDQTLKQQRRAGPDGVLVRSPSVGSLHSQESMKLLDFDDNEEAIKRLALEEKSKAWAVIAAGFGLGDDVERRRRKQRKRMVAGAVAVMVVAIVVGVVMQSRSKQLSVGGLAELSDGVTETCRNSGSSSSVTVLATCAAVELHSGPSSSLALADTRARGGALGRKSPVAVQSVPQVNLILALLFKIVFHEALMLGDRVGEVGGAIIMPPLKALVTKSKLVAKDTRQALSRKKKSVHESKAVVYEGASQLEHSFILNLLTDGLGLGAAQLKVMIDELRRAAAKKTCRAMEKLRSTLVSAANELDESHIPANSLDTRSLARTRLHILEEEFRLPDLNQVTRTIQRLIRELVHVPLMRKLLEIKNIQRVQSARLVQFRDKQLDKMVQFAHAKLVASVGNSMKKAIESSEGSKQRKKRQMS